MKPPQTARSCSILTPSRPQSYAALSRFDGVIQQGTSLRRTMEQLMDEALRTPALPPPRLTADIYESVDGDAYIVEIPVPGLDATFFGPGGGESGGAEAGRADCVELPARGPRAGRPSSRGGWPAGRRAIGGNGSAGRADCWSAASTQRSRSGVEPLARSRGSGSLPVAVRASC